MHPYGVCRFRRAFTFLVTVTVVVTVVVGSVAVMTPRLFVTRTVLPTFDPESLAIVRPNPTPRMNTAPRINIHTKPRLTARTARRRRRRRRIWSRDTRPPSGCCCDVDFMRVPSPVPDGSCDEMRRPQPMKAPTLQDDPAPAHARSVYTMVRRFSRYPLSRST